MAEVSKQEFDRRYREWCEEAPGTPVPLSLDRQDMRPDFRYELSCRLGIYPWRISFDVISGHVKIDNRGLAGDTSAPAGPRFKMDTLTEHETPELIGGPIEAFWREVYVASINAFEQDPASAADAAVKALKERRTK